jgi:hypothetical protein
VVLSPLQGSGFGRLVFFMALVGQVERSVGVELVKQRYEEAVQIKQRMLIHLNGSSVPNASAQPPDGQSNGPKTAASAHVAGIHFKWMDILQPHALANATHVYCASTCFSANMLRVLADRLLNSSTVRSVASLVALPFGEGVRSRRAELERVGTVGVSWKQRPIAVHFYFLSGNEGR